ncbi:hypothetical protein ACXDTM_005108 [Klebsiella quasipneumoniae]|uniref:hypothetical protein n=1 Tax=Klebsiella pneumoniae TaxID=573 RepID=UPI001917DAAF|nr:hypothetical protein [Klebsiella pneumoniae]HCQ8676212.1 hypothetical protein [Klebsiella variicola]HED2157297.1 hypothetical protein [Klebsiella variicola subsp. variicola]
MLKNTFKLIEENSPVAVVNSFTQKMCEEKTMARCNELVVVSENLFAIVKNTVSKHLLTESKLEFLVCKTPQVIEVCTARLRPSSDYYASTGSPLPSPENPEGNSAAGIELSTSFLRGCAVNGQIKTPQIIIKFNVWGRRERLAFLEYFFIIQALCRKAY